MESSARLSEWTTSATDWLDGQEWFQQIKAKWEELDPQSRLYLKAAGLISALMLVLFFVLSSIWGVHSLKRELSDKNELLNTIQSANEEMRRLKDVSASLGDAGAASGGAWGPYLEGAGANAGLDKTVLTVGPEKAGAASDQTKETLLDVSLKHVSIRQVVRYAFNLENGTRPVKLRNLTIDTKADPQGFMDATLALSGFTLVAPK